MGNGRQTILDRLRKTFRIDYDDDCLDKWEGIELVTKSLDQQTESRIGMLLVNALLVFCITVNGGKMSDIYYYWSLYSLLVLGCKVM